MAQGVHGSAVVPTVHTASGVTKSAPGYVHWVTLLGKHGAAVSTVQIKDGVTDTGTIRFQGAVNQSLLKGSQWHCVFDPPIEFSVGIYTKTSVGTATTTVGYS